ncbi:hypothetical protein QAD02_020782 [Eretmocerus hayati]|uniref:Uncharacterized protein n=1 Tax=Eretmocerus hayati TaxID=131215 RepID=A0ACC2PNV3_9HYME|nr:hypothetical protein QAD02_020782 [Eretmocerus hayati]
MQQVSERYRSYEMSQRYNTCDLQYMLFECCSENRSPKGCLRDPIEIKFGPTVGLLMSSKMHRVSERFPNAAARYPFETCGRILIRRRSKFLKNQTIGKPKSLSEFTDRLRNTPGGKQLRVYEPGGINHKFSFTTIRHKKNEHVALWDNHWAKIIGKVKKFSIDATYKAAHKINGVVQLLTMMAFVFESDIPFFWVLMTGRKEGDYASTFRFMQREWPEIKPRVIICDFGKALHNAIQNFWLCHVLGSFFHYAQAIFCQAIKKKVLRKKGNKKKDKTNYLLVEKFVTLVLLPRDEIEQQLKILIDECREKTGSRFNELITYYKDTWINGYTIEIFSVFLEIVRTNNAIEAYHRLLNSLLISLLTASCFIKLITRILQSYRVHYKSLVKDLRVNRRPKRLFVIEEKMLLDAWARYQKPEIDGSELFQIRLSLVSPLMNNLDYTVGD